MVVVREVRPAGHWPTAKEVDRITLPYDQRHRRRLRLIADAGTEVLLDLPVATLLREGDGLKLPGGAYIQVRAASEDLIEVTAPDPVTLVRLVWHLGNRHLPADFAPNTEAIERILIHRDHVIENMLAGLGATLRPVRAAFNPESGAYDGSMHHGHGHHSHSHQQHSSRDRGHRQDAPDLAEDAMDKTALTSGYPLAQQARHRHALLPRRAKA